LSAEHTAIAAPQNTLSAHKKQRKTVLQMVHFYQNPLLTFNSIHKDNGLQLCASTRFSLVSEIVRHFVRRFFQWRRTSVTDFRLAPNICDKNSCV